MQCPCDLGLDRFVDQTPHLNQDTVLPQRDENKNQFAYLLVDVMATKKTKANCKLIGTKSLGTDNRLLLMVVTRSAPAARN